MFSYTLSCAFTEEAVAREWVDWLRNSHLADVCAAGALDAEIVRLDSGDNSGGATCRFEVRYHFASREAFEAYQRDHAPRLRADGLKLFPPQRGVTYERNTGEVLAQIRA